jgi:hypothetical protein
MRVNDTVQGVLQAGGLLAFIAVVFAGVLLLDARLGRDAARVAEDERPRGRRDRWGPRSPYLAGTIACHTAAPGEGVPDHEYT